MFTFCLSYLKCFNSLNSFLKRIINKTLIIATIDIQQRCFTTSRKVNVFFIEKQISECKY